MGIGKKITDNGLTEKAEEKSVESKDSKKEIVFFPEEPKYSLEDIIVPASVEERIRDVVEYNTIRQIVFEEWGLNKTHRYSKGMGINLYGPPGTGKTMAAHAIARSLGRKIISVNYADIESKYVGETPKNIRSAFKAAKESNSILFFDEADAILSRRVTNMTNATDVSVNQTRSVMLMLMNEYQDFIIFATNFLENFDPAFVRRISFHVKFDLPDTDCRKKLWKLYIPEKMPTNLDFDEIAEKFAGVSGSDIYNAVLNAALKAARKKMTSVDKELFFTATQEILDSKAANEKSAVTVEKRPVSEDYVREQMSLQKEDV
ncbi:ATP-binding protein [Succinimonas sp.]|uniref:ATP-binding protein n=1 Tax=Succinimonas sp. TaxID=1936151 RepID=UPI003867E62B